MVCAPVIDFSSPTWEHPRNIQLSQLLLSELSFLPYFFITFKMFAPGMIPVPVPRLCAFKLELTI